MDADIRTSGTADSPEATRCRVSGQTGRMPASPDLDTLPDRLDTAVAYATSAVPVAHPDQTVASVRSRLVGQRFDSVADIAVLVDQRLVGLVTIERVLAASDDEVVAGLMDEQPPSIGPGVDREVVAWTMVGHGENSLPVVDATGTFLGLIPPDHMLRVLLEEHEEDLDRLGGVLRRSQQARTASEEPLRRRLVHRLPWLVLGLAGAMVSAWLVGSAEDQLTQTVQLAFFLPAIVYMADAVGTQTETLTIRGLSVGIAIGRVLPKELGTGMLIGALIALVFAPFSLWLFDDTDVALTVSLALFTSCTLASVVALALPWLLSKVGRDPAFGSGPLATLVQDLLSLTIYLGLAAALVA